MDLRIQKTEHAIKNAFIELRSKKPLEKITVKELCELAMINKSTFYSHYEDIYALSETMEQETVASRLNHREHRSPERLYARKIRYLYAGTLSGIHVADLTYPDPFFRAGTEPSRIPARHRAERNAFSQISGIQK